MHGFHRLDSLPAALIVSLPLWWLLGLDQAVWLVVGVLLASVAVRRKTVPWSFVAAAALFVAIIAFAGAVAVEGDRWITLVREGVIASAFFAAALGAMTYAVRRGPLRWLVYSLAAFFAISAAASMAAFLSGDALTFRSPVAGLVPDAIASTRLGEVSFTERSLGTESVFAGHLLLRPQGLFLFSTSQAVAASVAVPLFLASGGWFRSWRWLFWTVALLTAVMLVLTTTRAAIFALIAASVLVWLARAWTKRGGLVRSRRQVIAMAVGAVVLVGLSGALLLDPVTRVISERSLESRTNLYLATIEKWAERPILGWGTEVDAPVVPGSGGVSTETPDPRDLPPLGSHSHYLGVLFKQGIVGVVAFAAVVAVVAGHAFRLFQLPRRGSDWIIVAFVASLIAATTESLWLDPATAIVVGVTWGLVMGLSRASQVARPAHASEGRA